jgi:2-dehydro-3-deoxygluconokinase
MVEFAPVGEGLYRRGFAGDTLNTCWHIAQLLGRAAEVGYCTRVGADSVSEELVAFIGSAGMDVAAVSRDPERTVGLYVIGLQGAERSFSYWRDASAARRLADDGGALAAVFVGCALIHVSGITLAVIGERGRANLTQALAAARAQGAVVSFDPNVRLRLWSDLETLRAAMRAALAVADIALPSFEDEAAVWGDADPQATIARIAAIGVKEVVVKNGPGPVAFACHGALASAPTPPAPVLRDTTGAGDSFNAGYLAARFVGLAPAEAVGFGQAVAVETIGCAGAMAPKERLRTLGAQISRRR